MSTQYITMEDGTEEPLPDHLRDGHQKGTRGFTDEYLASLHETLHQPQRDPRPEHTHPREALQAQDAPRGA